MKPTEILSREHRVIDLDAARLRHLSFVVVSDADSGANFTPKRDERC